MKWNMIIQYALSESKKNKKGIKSRNQLQKAMGWQYPAGIYQCLRHDKVTLQTFCQMMNLLGYDVLMIPRDPKMKAFKAEDDL